MTIIMRVDLAGPRSRGLAVGLNEFAVLAQAERYAGVGSS
jgi:hypothetical protein